jgi:Leucine-rich repeat (LRR) protein
MSLLTVLKLEDNKLVGSLPSELALLTMLKDVYLENNFLTGPIPVELFQLSSLKNIYLGNNNLSAIPTELINLTSIERISLYNNSGIDLNSIPSWLSSVIVEPCIICDGEGTYDYVKSIDEEVISWSDECSQNISSINNRDFTEMLTYDECNLLIERCVICHNNVTNK